MAETSQRPQRRPRGEAEDEDQRRQENLDADMTTEKDGRRTDTSATLAPLAGASAEDWLGSNPDPDVMLSVPNLGIDHIGIEVDNIRAHVELHAKVLDLLELHVGAQVSVEKVAIDIENVRVQAMLKVKLQEVYKIVDRVMTTIDNNPEILTNLTGGLGKGLEGALKGGTGGSDSTSGAIEGKVERTDDSDHPERSGKQEEQKQESSKE